MKKHKHLLKQQKQGAFTLVEVLITISVIGILAGIVVIGYQSFVTNAQQASISATVDAYTKTLNAYSLEKKSYPKLSTCIPKDSECCVSNVEELPDVYCGTRAEAGGTHNIATDSTLDDALKKYTVNGGPTLPNFASFPNCVSGLTTGNPCKATPSIPTVGMAYISNVAGSKYTSTEPSVENRGFLIYYVEPKYKCGSNNIMTVTGSNLVFNSSATYTRQTSVYRECIVGLRH